MKTILYLSPHFDDVVFSCSSHLLEQRTQGNRIIVATVFTEGDHAERKKEDLTALESFGAEHRWLGYLDAPFRNEYYNSFERIVLGDAQDFTLDLKPLVEELQPDQIIAPLAVGTHIDHRLVFDAVRRLNFAETTYYEDRPYSLVKGATALRLNQIGYESDLPTFGEFWESFLSARYVEEYLGEDERSVRDRLANPFTPNQSSKIMKVVWSGQSFMPAINAYKSQLQGFVSDDFLSKLERLFYSS